MASAQGTSQVVAPSNSASSFPTWYVYYNSRGSEDHNGWIEADPDGFLSKVNDFFTGDREKYYQEYQQKLSEYNSYNEYQMALEAQKQSQAFEKMMSDTAYQRAYKDLLATGLNPRLLLSSNISASTPSSSSWYSQSSSQNTSQSTSTSKSESFSKSALLTAFIVVLGKLLLA